MKTMQTVFIVLGTIYVCTRSYARPVEMRSLSPNMSMRQSAGNIMITSMEELNKREESDQVLTEKCQEPKFSQYRTLSGFCNNPDYPFNGMANTVFSVLSGPLRTPENTMGLPNPRLISSIVCNEDGETDNSRNLSELIVFFGQFLDHTITKTSGDRDDEIRIYVPVQDKVFSTKQYIPFHNTKKEKQSPINELSSFVDAASVYGVSDENLKILREGPYMRLPNNMLPIDNEGMFIAGDGRANENHNLIAFHLLFAREHNSVAEEVIAAFPDLSDDETFELARHIVSAELQAVVYYNYIPALTGKLLDPYQGFDMHADPSISNRFSTVAFRVGHTMLKRTITSIDQDGNPTSIMLRDAFFRPDKFESFGMDGLFRGMMKGHASEIDNEITGEVRNFLFQNEKEDRQLDLATLNIQRGRDHGVPLCNDLRADLSLPRFTSFDEMAMSENVARKLDNAYNGEVDIVDSYICGISEPHVEGSSLGSLFHRIVRREFTRLRDGDNFYFEKDGYFTDEQIDKLESVKRLVGPKDELPKIFNRIIFRNTGLKESEINEKPFFTSPKTKEPVESYQPTSERWDELIKRCTKTDLDDFFTSVNHNWPDRLMTVHAGDNLMRAVFSCNIMLTYCSNGNDVGVGEMLNKNGIIVSDILSKCEPRGKNSRGVWLYDCIGSEIEEFLDNENAMITCKGAEFDKWNCPECQKVKRCVNTADTDFFTSAGLSANELVMTAHTYANHARFIFGCSKNREFCESPSGKGAGEVLNDLGIPVSEVQSKCQYVNRNNKGVWLWDCRNTDTEKRLQEAQVFDKCSDTFVDPLEPSLVAYNPTEQTWVENVKRCTKTDLDDFFMVAGYGWPDRLMTAHAGDNKMRAVFSCDIMLTDCSNGNGVGVGETLNANGITVSQIMSKCSPAGKNSRDIYLYDCIGSEIEQFLDEKKAMITCKGPEYDKWNCPDCQKVKRCVNTADDDFFTSAGLPSNELVMTAHTYADHARFVFECTKNREFCEAPSGKGAGEVLNDMGITVSEVQSACQYVDRNSRGVWLWDCRGSEIQTSLENADVFSEC